MQTSHKFQFAEEKSPGTGAENEIAEFVCADETLRWN